MSNLFDYLAWRGDLTLTQAPLNEVDCLIFSRFTYLALDEIVPHDFNHEITLAQCAQKYFNLSHPPYLQQKDDEKLLQILGQSTRFAQLKLCGFRNEISVQHEKQLACVTIKLPQANLIAYRGTDDTLVGLKEDLNMSFMDTVPCQQDGLKYFTAALQALPEPFYVTGHSKGGNIALYIALFCNSHQRQRLKKVYSFDGPGFSEKILHQIKTKAAPNLIAAYVPQSSIIGMLLGHIENYTVVHSQQTSILQHDLYSWDILAPNSFVCEQQVDASSLFIDQTLKDWLNEISDEQRQNFINIVFDVLKATQATRLQELTTERLTTAKKMLTELSSLDKQQRSLALNLVSSLIQTGIKNRNFLKN